MTSTQQMPSDGISAQSKSPGLLFNAGLVFSITGIFFVYQAWGNPETIWKDRLLSIVYALFGLGLLLFCIYQAKKNWHAKDARLFLPQPNPYAGEELTCELMLSAPYLQNTSPGDLACEVALVQYEEDRSGSGVANIRIHKISQVAIPAQLTDGRWRVQACFDVPADAPPSGSVRNGNKVYWQIESAHLASRRDLVFAVFLQAARMPAQRPVKAVATLSQDTPFPSNDLHWRQPKRSEKEHDRSVIEALAMGEQPMPWPTHVVRIHEDTQMWSARFPRMAWKFFSLLLAGLAVYMLFSVRGQVHSGDLEDLIFGLLKWFMVVVLLGASLHTGTKRWRLMVNDEGFAVDTGSALFSRVKHFSAAQAQALQRLHVYDRSSSSHRESYFSVALSAQDASQRITPALPGLQGSAALAHHFWQALAHRRMRFAAEGQAARQMFEPHALLRLGAWLLWGALALGSVIFIVLSPKLQLADVMKPGMLQAQFKAQSERLSAKSFKHSALLKAHRYNSPEMVEKELADGADANALGSDGVSLLIEAADSGQIEIVRMHLKYGANVNVRNTVDPNKLGDTPLLVALYRGRWDVAQLLLESGADIQAKNRWDWGAMHMAAQSDCMPCLEGLLAKGFSPNEPAPASRGESPVMLAAGKDKLPALKWLVAHGGSLQQKDPQGQNALAWAEFFKRQNTAAWIRAQPAATP
jgi:ankyrin repeat protein